MLRMTMILAVALAAVGCGSSAFKDYCESHADCIDPAKPFCDVDGVYAASGGHGKVCIPAPLDAGATDAAVPDAGEVDATAPEPDASLADASLPDASVDASVPDASEPDATAPMIDAGLPDADIPTSTREGEIRITDLRVIDSAASSADWWRGASVSISYTELPRQVEPDFDSIVPPGIGCIATHYNLAMGEAPDKMVDEGIVTFGGEALLSQVGQCVQPAADADYICIAGAGALAAGDVFHPNADDGTAGNGASVTATIIVAAGDFDVAGQREKGMWISLSGFSDPTAGAGDLDPFNGSFPVVAVASATQLVVAFTAPALPDGVITGSGTFALIGGVTPTPAPGGVPFLDGTKTISVSKTAGSVVEAFTDQIITPGGQGWALDAASLAAIRQFPFDSAEEISLGCEVDGTACAVDADANAGAGVIVAITAVNGDLTGAGAFDLPMGTQLVTVSCRAFGTHVIVPVGVLDVIESIGPTRIRTMVRRVNFALFANGDGLNLTTVTAGFGYVGYSTTPALK